MNGRSKTRSIPLVKKWTNSFPSSYAFAAVHRAIPETDTLLIVSIQITISDEAILTCNFQANLVTIRLYEEIGERRGNFRLRQ